MTLENTIGSEAGVKRLTSPQEVLAFCRERGIKMVDIKFTDLPGLLQHYTVPITEWEESTFTNGIGFDGSSIRGFQPIQESDMLLIPDPTTALVDPTLATPTLTMFANVKDPITGELYTRDPRYIAQKAEAYLKTTGLADISYWGPELEFFVFDDVRYDSTPNVPSTVLTPSRARGTPAASKMAATWATRSATRKATSRPARRTPCRSGAPRLS